MSFYDERTLYIVKYVFSLSVFILKADYTLNYIDLFLNFEANLHFLDKNHLIKTHLIEYDHIIYMIIFTCSSIRFANILLSIFASIFMGDVGLRGGGLSGFCCHVNAEFTFHKITWKLFSPLLFSCIERSLYRSGVFLSVFSRTHTENYMSLEIAIFDGF